MGRGVAPVYRLESYNAKKKTYVLVPRFGPRFASMFPETLYAKQEHIDPILKEAGYLPGDTPVAEPLLVEILDVENDKVRNLRRFMG
ncbi:hypothetical protein HY639_05970 [Candidatus Woesearchaeota archaeon]|nr:hypothetical protein [Candidatus Woesearchaeota archaeon]